LRYLICLALVGAIASCGVSSAAPSTSASATVARCGPGGAHTLAASPQARIYSWRGSVYGCTVGHRLRLGSVSRCVRPERVGPVVVAGDLAAYAVTSCGIDTGSTQVIVTRLSTGRRLSTHAASSIILGPESFASVGSIVVNRAGQVAWIASASSIATHRRAVQVLAADQRRTRVLDSSLAIAPGSLQLRGSKLSWKQGAAVHAAKLD
jgi:hypothetical protein